MASPSSRSFLRRTVRSACPEAATSHPSDPAASHPGPAASRALKAALTPATLAPAISLPPRPPSLPPAACCYSRGHYEHSDESDRPVRGFRSPGVGGRVAADGGRFVPRLLTSFVFWWVVCHRRSMASSTAGQRLGRGSQAEVGQVAAQTLAGGGFGAARSSGRGHGAVSAGPRARERVPPPSGCSGAFSGTSARRRRRAASRHAGLQNRCGEPAARRAGAPAMLVTICRPQRAQANPVGGSPNRFGASGPGRLLPAGSRRRRLPRRDHHHHHHHRCGMSGRPPASASRRRRGQRGRTIAGRPGRKRHATLDRRGTAGWCCLRS